MPTFQKQLNLIQSFQMNLQKRYFEKISVFYTKNEQLAKAVKKEMGRHNPNLLVNIQHIKNDRFKKKMSYLFQNASKIH